jgi:hypothetical protein
MMSLVRTDSSGIRRYFSPYLASAFLMLYGGYQLLYQSGSNPYRDVFYIFGTQVPYQFLMVMLASYLYRKGQLIEDAFLLFGILGFFMFDLLFIQHLYGWIDQTGIMWAVLNGTVSLILLILASIALGLRVNNRLTITLGSLICFLRFAPRVLLESKVLYEVSFSYVLLGWLFALCLAPLLIFPEPKSKDDALPIRKVEKCVLPAAFTVAILHFVSAGKSFNLPWSLMYIAPFCALLPLALHRLYEFHPSDLKKIGFSTSVFSVFLAASIQSAPIFDVFGIGEGPFTPFWFTLLLTTIVSWRLSSIAGSPALAHFSALTFSMSFLGGNLSEVLVTIFYPQTWHILFVALFCIAVSSYTRLTHYSILLNILPSLLIASWLSERQIPFFAGFLMTTAIGTLLLETTCRISLVKHLRLLLIAILLVFPLFYLFVHGLAIHKILLVLIGGTFLARGLIFRQPHYLWPSVIAAGVAAIGYPLSVQSHNGASTGRIFIQLAFVLLILGFTNSMYGSRIRSY